MQLQGVKEKCTTLQANWRRMQCVSPQKLLDCMGRMDSQYVANGHPCYVVASRPS